MKFFTTIWITPNMILSVIDEDSSTPALAETSALTQARERLGPFQPDRIVVETVRS